MILVDGFEVNVKRSSRRRSVGLKVCQGRVVVSSPAFLSDKQIQALIVGKASWIKRQLASQVVRNPLQYREGESLLYLGQLLILKLAQGRNHCELSQGGQLQLTLPSVSKPHLIRKSLINWYKQQASLYLNQRVEFFAQLTGLTPTGMAIKTFKARWGSCSRQGIIDFNWQLMMIPAEVIDYVVVHELCHLKYFNHSKQFWGLVSRFLPDYNNHKIWLKHNGQGILAQFSLALSTEL